MLRKPEYYASNKTTMYDLLAIYAEDVMIIAQDKNGKMVDCFFVKEARELPNHYLFDVVVSDRTYCSSTKRLLVKLDFLEA